MTYRDSTPDDSDLRDELPAGLCEVPGCSDYGSHRFTLTGIFVCARHFRLVHADVNGEGYGGTVLVDTSRALSRRAFV
jgi:hypothetical protein